MLPSPGQFWEAELETAAAELEAEASGCAAPGLESELDRALQEAAAELETQEGEPFFTRVQPVPHLPGYEEGHEVLTRMAASGLLSGADLDALVLGVIRPDRGGASYWNFPRAALHSFDPAAQRSHSLRRTPSTALRTALAEIRDHLASLYRSAEGARTRRAALEWVGEALHLIQDSYSGAHVERAVGAGPGGTSPIRHIRAFYATLLPPSRSTAPHEHNVPSDPRDSIWALPGALRIEAGLAVNASREYLGMLLRHLASPTAPGNAAEFADFLNRHFSL
jgi:hypothetical protein